MPEIGTSGSMSQRISFFLADVLALAGEPIGICVLNADLHSTTANFARSDASAVRPRRGNADRGRWCDANVVAWNIANEDRACGYARAHNSNPYPACGKGGPLRLICAEKGTLEVRDIDRFRACGRCGERQNCNQQKLPGSHRPAPFSWTTHSTGRAVRACAKLRHRPTKINPGGRA